MKKVPIATFCFVVLFSFLATTLLPYTAQAQPKWKDFDTSRNGKGKNKGKKGPPADKGKKKNSSNTLLICHRPPANENASDTATQKEIEMVIGAPAWKAHKKHGDSKGGCGAVQLQETIQVEGSEGAIKDAAFDRQGNLSLIETEKSVQFYENGEVIKSLEKDGHFLKSISEDEDLYVTICRGERIVCSLYNDRGTKVGEMPVGDFPGPGTLVGTKMVLTGNSDDGEGAAIRDLATGETIWSSPTGNFARFSAETTDYFFLRERRDDPAKLGGNHKLIELHTGNVLGEIAKNAVMIGISEDNNYIYFATRQENSKSIEVYDFNLNQIVTWRGLPKVGMYRGRFFEDLRKLVVPILETRSLFLGNYQSLSSKTFSFPNNFFPGVYYHDDNENLFFISGVENPEFNACGLKTTVCSTGDRKILIFDAKQEKFLENVSIPFEEIAKDPDNPTKVEKKTAPVITGFPANNKLLVRHFGLGVLQIYEY